MADAEDDASTLQKRLEAGDADRPEPMLAGEPVADPAALLQHLDDSGHFHRDSRAGRMYHPGMVSLREDVPTDSLHVSVDDNRLKAHIDHASPLAVESNGGSRYSVVRATVHNVVGMANDLISIVRGRQGDHACRLDCEWVSEDAGATPRNVPLLDPKTSAWGVQFDVRVAGSLDEARLRSALDTLVGVGGAGAKCLDVVDCEDDEALDAARRRLHTGGPPLAALPPFAVVLARHRAGDVLMLTLNHAAVDGFGAVRVVERLARAYDGSAQDALDFLACADLPVQPAPPSSSRVVRLGRNAVERVRDALSKPPCVAADGGDDEPGYGFHLVGLSGQGTRDVTGGGGGVTRDALVAALHLTIARWNEQRGIEGRRIGVLVPVDLRPADMPERVAANLSVNTRLSTTRRERADPASALRAITWHSARDEATRTGIALIAALQRARMLTLWAKQSTIVLQPLVNNDRADAAMLCDLGTIASAPRFGHEAGEVREMWFSPPSRSPRCLCVGAVALEGRLHLTFRYPHALFAPAAISRFADLYLAQLERVGASSS